MAGFTGGNGRNRTDAPGRANHAAVLPYTTFPYHGGANPSAPPFTVNDRVCILQTVPALQTYLLARRRRASANP